MNSELQSRAGLYIHVPFCTSVCPYCDFAVTIAGPQRRRNWVDGVVREAAMYAGRGFDFDTVYFGGGTPSSLSADHLAEAIDGLRRELDIGLGAWCHLEINPEDVTPDRVVTWRGLGVRFVSLGVQAFDDESLAWLGRRHSAAQAVDAAEQLLDGGFDTVSLDLIYGLPGQQAQEWVRQLDLAIGLGAHHLSCYQLTIHPRTLFGRRRERGLISELPNDQQADLFFVTHEELARKGLPGYEVSNFALRPSHRSRHNRKYWNFSPYLGLGPSAHSFRDGRRWWNHRKVRHWQTAVDAGRQPVEGSETLSAEETVLEVLMLGLRTVEGVDLSRLSQRYGFDLEGTNANTLEHQLDTGLVELRDGNLCPTTRGLAVADTLARSYDLSAIQTPSPRIP